MIIVIGRAKLSVIDYDFDDKNVPVVLTMICFITFIH